MDYLVSVVVPVFNLESQVEGFVNSLLIQTYKRIQIVLVDDGSKDSSGEICDKLSKKDERIIVIHQKNSGSGPARNSGIDASSGDYIYFPDADDKLENDSIEKMVMCCDDQVDLVVFGYRCLNKRNKIVYEKRYPNVTFDANEVRLDYSDFFAMERPYSIQGAPWNKLFSLKIIKREKIRYPELRRHQDDAFISRYMCHSKKIRFSDSVLYYYYINDLKKEWLKFPVTYINDVIGLYLIKKETVLSWNPNDVKTKQSVESEYICKSIKAIELAFSPKMGFSKKERKEWIFEKIGLLGLKDFSASKYMGKYQKTILSLIKHDKTNRAIFIIALKVRLEKTGLMRFFRKKRV